MRVIEASMEQRRNERARETGDHRENPPTCGIVRHDSNLRKSMRRRGHPLPAWIAAGREMRGARSMRAATRMRGRHDARLSHGPTCAANEAAARQTPVETWRADVERLCWRLPEDSNPEPPAPKAGGSLQPREVDILTEGTGFNVRVGRREVSFLPSERTVLLITAEGSGNPRHDHPAWVEVGALGGPVQSANIVVGVPLHSEIEREHELHKLKRRGHKLEKHTARPQEKHLHAKQIRSGSFISRGPPAGRRCRAVSLCAVLLEDYENYATNMAPMCRRLPTDRRYKTNFRLWADRARWRVGSDKLGRACAARGMMYRYIAPARRAPASLRRRRGTCNLRRPWVSFIGRSCSVTPDTPAAIRHGADQLAP
ncbi:hypothetical protein PR048_007517 [Dryococelus australis]|uniref:Uncharacterized protein n=1 Tax=Dryococelus australis TaxID=614101 RepID=A0ABQ9HUF8_9NEOP|nr:hypothetical protein PR048_007517 [Dryococelus australis]